MNGLDLKNSILQLAIQGKLVEQREEEGTAEELLKQIEAEKEALIKEKKIRKQKALPEITEDEKPFDIPENWEWVRLGYLSNYGKCNSVATKDIPHDAWLLDLEDIERDSGKILNKKRMRDTKSMSNKHVFYRGDVLYSKLRPYLNKVIIADEDGYSTSEILPLDFGENIYNRYAQTVLMSPYFIYYTVKCSYGVKMPRLGTTDGQLAIFPLPPIEEQKRIVAKIEKLMPYIEEYDKAYTEVIELNKNFPEDMQKSILQYAIQGKLVEQRDEEGTAEELYQSIQAEKKKLIEEGEIKKTKALPEIVEEEIPFEIPESWKWVRLGEVSERIHYGYTASAKEKGDAKLLRITDIQNDFVNWEDVPYCNIKDTDYAKYDLNNRDILIARTGGTIGKTYIVDLLSDKAVFASYLIRAIPVDKINEKYLKNFMDSPLYWNQLKAGSMGTGQPNVNATTLSQLLIPLPPLEEQKRIVEKIEEMLPYTKKLIK
ncbi:restriction endonuclease subunit S [Oceanobacillus sp. M60]